MRLQARVPVPLVPLLARLRIDFEIADLVLIVLHLQFIILQMFVNVFATGIVPHPLIFVEVALDLRKHALLLLGHVLTLFLELYFLRFC